MNAGMDQATISPEVQEFLDTVRAQLGDLDPDERRDITEGLEADLSELVAEQGSEALGDPVTYARELRQAAGLTPAMGPTPSPRRPAGEAVNATLDGGRARWDRLVTGLPGKPWELLVSLRPVWWVLRAWVALQAVDLVWGGGGYGQGLSMVPSLRGLGLPLLVVAVLVSVQLGRGHGWPTARAGALGRVTLLALNLAALAFAPSVVESVGNDSKVQFSHGYNDGFDDAARTVGADKAGVYLDGKWVSQIYPYDAQGRPLVGVQLFNQVGLPIKVVTQPEFEDRIDGPTGMRIFYPWTNGTGQLTNVFPIPSRLQEEEGLSPTAFTEAQRPRIGPFPLASVPEVSLPGIHTGVRPGLARSGATQVTP